MSKRKKKRRTPGKGKVSAPEAAAAAGLRWPSVRRSALPALGLLIALVGTLTLGFVWNEDLWWYLASGGAILDRGEIPETDLFLYTLSEDARWWKSSWLWTVLMAGLERGTGVAGMVVFGAAVAVAITVLLFGCARIDRFGLVNGLFTALVVATAAERLCLKAELATWLLLIIFFYLLDRDAPITWRTLAILALLQWLWAHLHAGYPLGIAVVLAYSVGGFLQQWRTRGTAALRSALGPGAAVPLWSAPALFAVCLLTPDMKDRFGLLRGMVGMTRKSLENVPRQGGESLFSTVNELEKTFETADSTYATLYLLGLSAGILGLILGRDHPRRLSRLCLVAGMAILGYTAVRHVSALVLAAALVAIAAIGDRQAGPAARRLRFSGRLYVSACVLFGLLILAATVGLWRLRSDFEVGQSRGSFATLSPLATCPGAADYILEHDLQGPIFNDMSLGGYLTYRLYPAHQLFIDNRLLRGQLINEYLEMSFSAERWQQAERQYGFRTVVLSNLMVPAVVPLRDRLSADRRWRLAFSDPLAVVFVRADVQAPPEIRFFGDGGPDASPFVTPAAGLGATARKAARLFFRTDVDAVLHQYLAVLGRLRRYGEVHSLASRALERRPQDAPLYRHRGSAEMMLRNPAAALEDLQRAARYGSDDPANHFVHAMILRDSGRLRQALAAIDRARRLDPSNTGYENLQRELSARLAASGAPPG